MIELVGGKVYSIEEGVLSQGMLKEFCSGEHDNDVLCVTQGGIKIYINAEDIKNQRIDEGCYELVRENVFFDIYSNPHIDGVVPLLNAEGEPVGLAKYRKTSYDHDYDCDLERIDTALFDLYECVCLSEVNEYSVLMYQQCFHTYKGKIILYGAEWKAILSYLGKAPEYAEVFVTSDEAELNRATEGKKAMKLMSFASNVAGYEERCKYGVFSYDEVMTLVYYFTRHKVVSGGRRQKTLRHRCYV